MEPHRPAPLDQQDTAEAEAVALDVLGRSPPRDADAGAPAFPRIFSHNCTTAVKKRLGVFGEGRPSLATVNPSYVHHRHHQSRQSL